MFIFFLNTIVVQHDTIFLCKKKVVLVENRWFINVCVTASFLDKPAARQASPPSKYRNLLIWPFLVAFSIVLSSATTKLQKQPRVATASAWPFAFYLLIHVSIVDGSLPVKITYLEKLEDPHETASMKTGA